MRLSKESRVLVTKPETFLGLHIIAELKRQGIEHIISDVGDLRERDDVIHNLKELAPDIVIHPRNVNFLLSDDTDHEAMASRSLDDLIETANLMEALLQASVKRFVTFWSEYADYDDPRDREVMTPRLWLSVRELLQAQGCQVLLYPTCPMYGGGMNFETGTGDMLAVCMKHFHDSDTVTKIQLPFKRFGCGNNWLRLSSAAWFAQALLNDIDKSLDYDSPQSVRNLASQYVTVYHPCYGECLPAISLTKLLARISGYVGDHDWSIELIEEAKAMAANARGEDISDDMALMAKGGMSVAMIKNLENDLREIYNQQFHKEPVTA